MCRGIWGGFWGIFHGAFCGGSEHGREWPDEAMGLSDIMDPKDAGAAHQPCPDRRQGALKSLLQSMTEDLSQKGLSRGPDEKRRPEAAEGCDSTQEVYVLLSQLRKADPRVKDDGLRGDASLKGAPQEAPQLEVHVPKQVLIASQAAHGAGVAPTVHHH